MRLERCYSGILRDPDFKVVLSASNVKLPPEDHRNNRPGYIVVHRAGQTDVKRYLPYWETWEITAGAVTVPEGEVQL